MSCQVSKETICPKFVKTTRGVEPGIYRCSNLGIQCRPTYRIIHIHVVFLHNPYQLYRFRFTQNRHRTNLTVSEACKLHLLALALGIGRVVRMQMNIDYRQYVHILALINFPLWITTVSSPAIIAYSPPS